MSYKLVPIEELRAIEMVFPHHLENLKRMIEADGKIRKPIIVDDKYNIVLDGSHRHIYMVLGNYKYIPVQYVNYEDPNIRVGSHLKHRFLDDGNIKVTKEEVIYRGLTGILYPPRTTRHFFPFRKYSINLPLDKIEKGNELDVSSHIAKVSLDKEIKHNENYIREIDEEAEEIENYNVEQSDTRRYLLKQIMMMKNESITDISTV